MLRSLGAIVLLAALAGCAGERPIHPFRLRGFPGAPIEENLFPRFREARWAFRDRLDPDRPLVLELRPDGTLSGKKEGTARLVFEGRFLEIREGETLLDRILPLEGKAGDSWGGPGATGTVFGYDRIVVLGSERRALVVAIDRPPLRDLYWFSAGIGWVRIRTERQGRVVRDATLVEFAGTPAN